MNTPQRWITSTHGIPDHRCPACGAVMDAVTTVMASPPFAPILPAPGDLSVCATCLAVNMFQEDGTLRVASTDECEVLPEWARQRIADRRGTMQ